MCVLRCLFFFFNDTATTEIYTLSLHDALPISAGAAQRRPPLSLSAPFFIPARRRASARAPPEEEACAAGVLSPCADRKSTRLNSSHANISYAVFCLKKKKTK